MEKLSHNDHIDLYRHLAFCTVGGFFGGYAILVHSGIMGNAQTVNLIELLMDFLRADGHGILLHTGALLIYLLGTMLTVLLPHWFGADTHLVSPFITAAAAVTVSFLPPDLTAVIALYHIFFAMSFQWSSYAGARGFYSSTIFSTNNTKQATLALASYLCDRDRAHLRKLKFYTLTLLCFHIGATASYFAVDWLHVQGGLLVLPFVAWGYVLAVCERRHEALAEIPETIPDNTAHPSV